MQLELTGCEVDLGRRRAVRSDGSETHLTTREAALLAFLAERPSQTVSRHQLLTQVWGYHDGVVSRAVDSVMRRLRTKVERDPGQPEHLLVDHGEGYRFEPARADGPAPLPTPSERPALILGTWRIDLARSAAVAGERTERLTANESALLERLARAEGAIVDRQTLQREIWGRANRSSRAVDNAIRRLRAKLEADPANPVWLLTARGQGYRLVAETSEPAREGAIALAALTEASELWERHPQAMWTAAGTLVRHLTERATDTGGFALAPAGDTYRFAFPGVSSAVRWALSVQRTLPRLDWPGVLDRSLSGSALAIGIAEGLVRRRSGPDDLIGPAVAAAEELLASAAPGVTLVPAATDLELPDEAEHVRVHTHAGADAVAIVPRGSSARLRSTVERHPLSALLPSQPLVGRAAELDRIGRRLDEAGRPMCLCGPSGIGKTRLALETARRSRGAVWVGLAGVGEQLATILSALGGQPGRRRADTLDQLQTLIELRRPPLLVLDDLERLEPDVAEVLELATERRWTRVLLTSQRRLAGAEILGIGPLSREDGWTLFTGLAGASDQVRDAVARLSGNPLAIELFAGSLDGSTDAEGSSGAPASLEQVVAFSLERSTPLERAVLDQLAVFEGGFTLQAARAVLAVEGGDAVAVLQDLRDRSLLRTIGRSGSGPRLDLEPAVRAALDRPDAQVLDRHGAWYSRLGRGDVSARVGRQPLVLAWLWQERANLTAVCRRGGPHGNRAYSALARTLVENGEARAALEIAEPLLAEPDVEGWAEVAYAAALASFDGGEGDRVSELLDALERVGLTEIPRAATRLLRARHALRLSRLDDAERWAREALQIAPAPTWVSGKAHATLAIVLESRSRFDAARTHFQAAIADHDAAGVAMMALEARSDYGCCLSDLGEHERARELFRAAADQARQLELRRHMAHIQTHLALVAARMGDEEGAVTELQACLETSRQLGESRLIAHNEVNLGTRLRDRGQLAEAADHIRSGAERFERSGHTVYVAWARSVLAGVLSQLGDPTALDEIGSALAIEIGDVDERCSILCRAVHVFLAVGDVQTARRYLDEARTLPISEAKTPTTRLRDATVAVAVAE